MKGVGIVWGLMVLALLGGGCASAVRKGGVRPDATALARRLSAMAPEAAPGEARLLAQTAVDRSCELAVQYRSIRPAWLHNCLVQSGLRERGLCWHWADDLEESLLALSLSSFTIHPIVARLGTLREHNAVAVSARGASFADGIVLDAWRKSGYLEWADLREDKYPWHKRIHLTLRGNRLGDAQVGEEVAQFLGAEPVQ